MENVKTRWRDSGCGCQIKSRLFNREIKTTQESEANITVVRIQYAHHIMLKLIDETNIVLVLYYIHKYIKIMTSYSYKSVKQVLEMF